MNILLRIEEDNFFTYKKKCQLPSIDKRECARHQRGMTIPASKVKANFALDVFAF